LDVRDLLVVVVTCVRDAELADDALLLQHLDLLLHGDPAGHTPRVGDRGVGEAQCVVAVAGVLRGVDHLLRFDHLQPGLDRVTLALYLSLDYSMLLARPDVDLTLLRARLADLFLFLASCRLRRGLTSGFCCVSGRVGGARGECQADCGKAPYQQTGASHQYSPW